MQLKPRPLFLTADSCLILYKRILFSAAARMLLQLPSKQRRKAMFASSPMARKLAVVLFMYTCSLVIEPTGAFTGHVITFRSHNLFPEGFDWDPTAAHFVVGSFRHGSLHSVSDAGLVESQIPHDLLPLNVVVGGVAVDSPRRRLLAVVHAVHPFPPFDALAAYDLKTRRRLFLSALPDNKSERPVANDVAVTPDGDAFVTNSAGNFIWKVDVAGVPSVFSDSPVYTSGHTIREELAPECGLNGIVHAGNGHLLAVQSNTGKLYRVNAADGTASLVNVSKDLTGADGIAVRSDGAAAVVSRHTAWLLKSDDEWSHAVVHAETTLDVERFPTGAAVRDDRFYALYGRIGDAMLGNVDREDFSIEEIDWDKGKEEKSALWARALLLLSFGPLLYVLHRTIQLLQLSGKLKKAS